MQQHSVVTDLPLSEHRNRYLFFAILSCRIRSGNCCFAFAANPGIYADVIAFTASNFLDDGRVCASHLNEMPFQNCVDRVTVCVEP